MFSLNFKEMRRGAIGVAVALSAALGGTMVQAQDWPTRPVTMVVPFGPGASNDTFTRAISNAMSKQLGQPFVVENQPGAGGYTATLGVSVSAPDGYKFVQMPSSVVGFAPILGVDLDPLTDLTPIASFARAPGGMVVPASLPVNSVQEFIEYAKQNEVFVGYTGIGATQHQMGELFRKSTGLDLKMVNYQSSAEAQTDLVAGRLHLMFATVASVRGQIDAGQLKLLAYTNDSFPPDSPAAPTLASQGVEGMEGAQVWWSVFGPKNLPDTYRDAMNKAINEALDDPELVQIMSRAGAVPSKMSSAEFVDLITAEKARVQEFLDFTGIKPNQ